MDSDFGMDKKCKNTRTERSIQCNQNECYNVKIMSYVRKNNKKNS